jgi:hypothetical protein
MSELVRAALAALGSSGEVARVAEALRCSRDAEAMAVFGLPADGATEPEPAFDHAALERWRRSRRTGASGFDVLDLFTAVVHPPSVRSRDECRRPTSCP